MSLCLSCDHMRNKTGGCQSLPVKPAKAPVACPVWSRCACLPACLREWARDTPWQVKCDVLKSNPVGNARRSRREAGAIAATAERAIVFLLYATLYINEPRNKASKNNNKLLVGCVFWALLGLMGGGCGEGRHTPREAKGWKDDIATSGDFAEGRAVLSHCSGDWTKARSDDSAAGGWKREESLSFGLLQGQRTMTQNAPKKKKNPETSLHSALFHAYTIMPSFYSVPLWTLLWKPGALISQSGWVCKP